MTLFVIRMYKLFSITWSYNNHTISICKLWLSLLSEVSVKRLLRVDSIVMKKCLQHLLTLHKNLFCKCEQIRNKLRHVHISSRNLWRKILYSAQPFLRLAKSVLSYLCSNTVINPWLYSDGHHIYMTKLNPPYKYKWDYFKSLQIVLSDVLDL